MMPRTETEMQHKYPKLAIIKALYLCAFDNTYRCHPSASHPQYLYKSVHLGWDSVIEIAHQINALQGLGLLYDTPTAGEKRKRRGNKPVHETDKSVYEKLQKIDFTLMKGREEGAGDRQILWMLAEADEKKKVIEERVKTLRARVKKEEGIILWTNGRPFTSMESRAVALIEGYPPQIGYPQYGYPPQIGSFQQERQKIGYPHIGYPPQTFQHEHQTMDVLRRLLSRNVRR
ncbi:hypothetical protein HYALB_00003760 [Hymenoscyphus albidus]|uniref:Uncharacterized protein n=1 Tax=Hymenoscyphus albidus TaxID=595503 RepID=A0A9N9LW69_9HELO|nr:hypothetical protein HYALB_00003760 [Hymenoscyphus albidus]